MKPRRRQQRRASTSTPAVATLTPLSEETLPVSAEAARCSAGRGDGDADCHRRSRWTRATASAASTMILTWAATLTCTIKLGCAVSGSSNDSVGINEFGTGPDYDRFMLWFSSEQQIYVLFPDQTWQSYRDTWDESQPEFSCNPLNAPPHFAAAAAPWLWQAVVFGRRSPGAVGHDRARRTALPAHGRSVVRAGAAAGVLRGRDDSLLQLH
jgi:hypothetical protein